MDGKRIAKGFGKLGEEDVGGFEEPPSLKLRKACLNDELSSVDQISERLRDMNHEDKLSNI